MFRKTLTFYKECIARAFRGKFWRVEKWTGGISLLLLLWIAMVPPDARTAQMLEASVPAYFFIGVFLLTVLIGLIVAPVEMYQEQWNELQKIERQRQPKLQIILPSGGIASVNLEGNTLETYGGTRVTTIAKRTSTAIYLLVTNLGEIEAKRCRARVLWACRETDGAIVESAGLIEAIELPWSKTDSENHLSADIAPGDTARVWVAHVRQSGHLWAFREMKDLPIHHQRVFGGEGHHKMLIQIDSSNVAPTQILLSIRTEKATGPAANGSWEPMASVSILGQGGPRLAHPDIPARIGEQENG